jgi:hypothetical protein
MTVVTPKLLAVTEDDYVCIIVFVRFSFTFTEYHGVNFCRSLTPACQARMYVFV